jgi:hypothetical protein
MVTVVQTRPRLQSHQFELREILEAARSCSRQITAWISALEASPVKRKRRRG